MGRKVEQLTLTEKIFLVEGKKSWYTNGVERLNIKSICLTDGPTGLRKATGNQVEGLSMSEIATAFPTSCTCASTWNEELIYQEGKAIGEECRHYNVGLLLGPGLNIKKNPLCGRNFEYYSEDPYISYKMASAFVKGIQDNNVGACLKHFACNNEENYRFCSNSIVDERALHEIYLRAFERTVKEVQPDAIMCSYNSINGVASSENKYLLTDLLRNEWEYKGFVITDWGATKDRIKGIEAGVDFDAPGEVIHNRNLIYQKCLESEEFKNKFDDSVSRVLSFIDKIQDNEKLDANFEEHSQLAKQIAIEGAVLLKNENKALPLKEDKKILVIGDLFEKMRYQGAGSSCLNPYKTISPLEAFNNHQIDYEFDPAYDVCFDKVYDLQKTIDKAKSYGRVLLFFGLDDYTELEGKDRDDMSLPKSQLTIINALIENNIKIDGVLFGGAPVELPFIEKFDSLLNMYLPGEMGGEACFELLFGKVSPSGRLAETWTKSLKDVPFYDEYSKTNKEYYKESIFVGYRYYLSKGIKVCYPFGYGLSYTDFKYDNLEIKEESYELVINIDITNVGDIDSKEVIEIYSEIQKSMRIRPKRTLIGFKKVMIKAHETIRVSLQIDKNALEIYDVDTKRFVLEAGDYHILIGKSSQNIIFDKLVKINGVELKVIDENIHYKNCAFEQITNDEFEMMIGYKEILDDPKIATFETRIGDYHRHLLGRILKNVLINISNKDLRKANKMPYSIERELKRKNAIFLKYIMKTNNARTLMMSSSGAFTYQTAKGFVEFENGHFIKGMNAMLKKEKELYREEEKNEG